jgi:HK97 family phage prohead protease
MLLRDYELRDAEVGGDGRTLVLACVPFDVEALVDDGDGPYREVFRCGAFEHVVRAPNRVELRYRHQQDGPPYGFGVDLVEDSKYLIGAFRVAPGGQGDGLLDLVCDRQLRGVSIGFVAGVDRRTDDGGLLVERVRVKRLGEVSLTPAATWSDARVLAMRESAAAGATAASAERERWMLRRLRLGLR